MRRFVHFLYINTFKNTIHLDIFITFISIYILIVTMNQERVLAKFKKGLLKS